MSDIFIASHIMLWGCIIIMAMIITALVRQVGVLYERIAPVGALMINQALKTGHSAPQVEAVDLDGNTVIIGGASNRQRSCLLFFVSPTCSLCKEMLPMVKSLMKSEQNWLDIVIASDALEAEHRRFIKEQHLEAFTYVSSEILGVSYAVSRLPYAVLIDDKGRIGAMGIIDSREQMESLFESMARNFPSIQDYLQRTKVAKAESHSH